GCSSGSAARRAGLPDLELPRLPQPGERGTLRAADRHVRSACRSRTMKVLDPRLLRHAAGTRRYVVVSVVIAVASGVAFVVAAFAISALVVRPFQDSAGLSDLRGPLAVLAAAVVFRA